MQRHYINCHEPLHQCQCKLVALPLDRLQARLSPAVETQVAVETVVPISSSVLPVNGRFSTRRLVPQVPQAAPLVAPLVTSQAILPVLLPPI